MIPLVLHVEFVVEELLRYGARVLDQNLVQAVGDFEDELLLAPAHRDHLAFVSGPIAIKSTAPLELQRSRRAVDLLDLSVPFGTRFVGSFARLRVELAADEENVLLRRALELPLVYHDVSLM